VSPPTVLVRIDNSRRRGKVVTVVVGLPLHPEGKRTLLQDLQRLCGAGGALKGGALELQGDHRVRVAVRMETIGYRVKIL